MIEYLLIPILFSLIVGFVAIHKFGVSDDVFLKSIYSSSEEISRSYDENEPLPNELKEIEKDKMNMKSDYEIMLSVLKYFNEGETHLSEIMMNENISWRKLQIIIVSLIRQDLIELDRDISEREITEIFNKYNLTVKGKRVLEYFKPSDDEKIKDDTKIKNK